MPNRIVITSDKAPKPIGPYSHAIRSGKMIYLSGQTGINPSTGELVVGGVAEETRQTLRNIGAVLEAAGVGLKDVVKTTVFLFDLSAFAEMNSVYGEFFFSDPPARSTVQVARLPKNAQVEIECIAAARED